MKKLGKKWNTLHKFVYFAAILLLFHYLLALKVIDSFAIFVTITIVILLVIRLPFVRRFFIKHQPAWAPTVNQFLTGRNKKTIQIKTKEK